MTPGWADEQDAYGALLLDALEGREAYELVEHGHLSEADFRDFVFGNPVRFYTAVNPRFFAGTAVEKEAAALGAEAPAR